MVKNTPAALNNEATRCWPISLFSISVSKHRLLWTAANGTTTKSCSVQYNLLTFGSSNLFVKPMLKRFTPKMVTTNNTAVGS